MTEIYLVKILIKILIRKGVIFTATIYSENQKNQAKNVDLINFLKQTEGFDFRQVGQNFRCVQHSSLVITADRKGFFWNSKGINGANVLVVPFFIMKNGTTKTAENRRYDGVSRRAFTLNLFNVNKI